MSKRQLIDEITMRNPTAKTEFLAEFKEADLGEYLKHLIAARRPRLSGGGNRYAKYFVSADRMSGLVEQAPVKSTVAVPMAQPAPVSPIQEAAPTEDLPLDQPEFKKEIQPALFTPPAADVNEPAQDEPLPVTDSTWREENVLPSEIAALETEPEARAARPAEVEMQEIAVRAPAELTMQSEPAPAKEEGNELSQDQPAQNALACWYRGEGEPIAVARDTDQQEQASDELEEINALPSPYGQDYHGEEAASVDEDAPPADMDEIEREEIAVQATVEDDVSDEEPIEEPAVEAALEDPAPDDAPVARKKKLQPVAVGAEQEGNKNQDSDSWLFSD